MNNISAVALFCSDVRQEKGGTETIVGVFPDNVNLPMIPCAFSQMYVYVRILILPSYRPASIVTRIVLPDGSEMDRSEMDLVTVETNREKVIASDASYIGLIVKFAVIPMQITQEGRLQVIVSVDGQDHIAGMLNCRAVPPTTT